MVIIGINNTLIGNTLIDLGAAINIMTWHTMEMLQLGPLLRPTPTILELADRNPIKPIGAIDDLIVTVASWEYPVDFLIISSRDPTKGHPVILGRPWLATANAFIGWRVGEMCISHSTSTKTLMLYPPTQPVEETLWWIEDPYGDENLEEPLLSLDQAKALHEQTEDSVLTQFLSSTECVDFPETFSQFDYIFSEEYQTHFDPSISTSASLMFSIDEQ